MVHNFAILYYFKAGQYDWCVYIAIRIASCGSSIGNKMSRNTFTVLKSNKIKQNKTKQINVLGTERYPVRMLRIQRMLLFCTFVIWWNIKWSAFCFYSRNIVECNNFYWKHKSQIKASNGNTNELKTVCILSPWRKSYYKR